MYFIENFKGNPSELQKYLESTGLPGKFKVVPRRNGVKVMYDMPIVGPDASESYLRKYRAALGRYVREKSPGSKIVSVKWGN